MYTIRELLKYVHPQFVPQEQLDYEYKENVREYLRSQHPEANPKDLDMMVRHAEEENVWACSMRVFSSFHHLHSSCEIVRVHVLCVHVCRWRHEEKCYRRRVRGCVRKWMLVRISSDMHACLVWSDSPAFLCMFFPRARVVMMFIPRFILWVLGVFISCVQMVTWILKKRDEVRPQPKAWYV